MAKTVLVIDDSISVRSDVEATLGQAGFQVLAACNGTEGVETLHSAVDVALVICDMNMPGMSGLDVLAEIQRRGQHAKLPVVIMTTEGNPQLIAQAKRLGAKGWILKPFKPQMLIDAARRLTA